MGRQLVVLTKTESDFQFREGRVSAETPPAVDLLEVLSSEGASLQPVFELTGVDGNAVPSELDRSRSDLSRYYRVMAPEEKLEQLAERLRKENFVEAAFIKPDAEPAQLSVETMNELPASPDLTPRQKYLQPAPGGVDALFAWTRPGGRGAGVNIIDIEGAWQFTHEDLGQNQGGVAGGVPKRDLHWRNHGTAVVGVMSGDQNAFGVTGICPDAKVRAISIFDSQGNANSSTAIVQAANMLNPGDIILIELHRPGPRATGVGQQGFIPIEWWPDDFEAIKFATSRGIIVVEAGGNGGENLDDPIYNTPSAGFPSTWTNPFNRNNRDSGAVVIGAGAPPEGTHGRNHGPDRSRLDFSNYGQIMDAQAWGREVSSTGYGDLQSGNDENKWYTDVFSGTSSASPIVVGVIACLQGILRAGGRALLNPKQARELLRSTGSPQQDATSRPRTQRIGNRPDLRQLISRI
ncbi:serine protease [Paenibacillus sp. A3]|nr:serine protease [Paenibacillus sp. A3]